MLVSVYGKQTVQVKTRVDDGLTAMQCFNEYRPATHTHTHQSALKYHIYTEAYNSKRIAAGTGLSVMLGARGASYHLVAAQFL